jgi:hypothetical protein
VEIALMKHLAAQGTHQQNTQRQDSYESKNLKIKSSMDEIKQYFIKSGLYVEMPRYIPEKHLEQAITNLHGFDPRTIKKWKITLEKYGQIRRNSSFQFEILT